MAKKNYDYGKLENGSITYAPNKLIGQDENGNSIQIFNGSIADYAAQGWLPVVKTEPPEAPEGSMGYYTTTYAVNNGEIRQSWAFVEYDFDVGV